jgi:hypothetical protein
MTPGKGAAIICSVNGKRWKICYNQNAIWWN